MQINNRFPHPDPLPEGERQFPDGEAALNYLFSSFESRHRFHVGKYDREFRKPEVLIDIATDLGVLPEPEKTCLVSGSKGKGSVARMIAWNLSLAGLRVGFILSPEEFDHFDRIRIGNKIIPRADFCRILFFLRPRLESVFSKQSSDFYFAPSGIFLLVALVWFKEQSVDAWVIEGGRGVLFDEIGQLNAKVGVVTNVMAEHSARLGPRLEDIAKDKLSLAERCKIMVLGESAGQWLPGFQAAPRSEPECVDRPLWFDELNAIAQKAAQSIVPGLKWRRFYTPAFFFAQGGLQDGRVIEGSVCCDAAIHSDCIDGDFLRRTGLSEGAVLIGLSEDKDGEAMFAKLNALGFKSFYSVNLSSRIGHIRGWNAEGAEQIAELDVINDVQTGLKDSLIQIAERHQSLYVIGVQVFIRSLRRALNVGIMGSNGFI